MAYCLHELIGKGSYGKVYRAAHKRDGSLCAFKVLPLDDDGVDQISEETRRELLSLRQCESPYVVNFHGAYVHGCQLWIAMEHCTVSVQGVMRLSQQPLREEELAAVCLHAIVRIE